MAPITKTQTSPKSLYFYKHSDKSAPVNVTKDSNVKAPAAGSPQSASEQQQQDQKRR